MAAEWPAQLDGVAHLRHVMEEGGDLAVVEPLDGELDARGILRRGRDGVAAFCAIAVRRGQPHGGSMQAAANTSSTSTPSHGVSSFDHLVTQ